ncbi:hypothetical protein CIPAW_16G068700 [Carya illinoinensis]|uniref:Uncharacterized protein n=1 Tax=Carya illinoinensis TaxID=32201 RepID=A0A8T1N777_CARIL|nr:hypothetical protein CIPAW_16G068700 [Carya illinoinensis]
MRKSRRWLFFLLLPLLLSSPRKEKQTLPSWSHSSSRGIIPSFPHVTNLLSHQLLLADRVNYSSLKKEPTLTSAGLTPAEVSSKVSYPHPSYPLFSFLYSFSFPCFSVLFSSVIKRHTFSFFHFHFLSFLFLLSFLFPLFFTLTKLTPPLSSS